MMCINVGNGPECFALCLTCSEDSYCGVEDACTSCYHGQYKISPNFSDLTFKCSKECDVGEPLEHEDYFYCHGHSSHLTDNINYFSKPGTPESNHVLFIIIFILIGLIFLFIVMKMILYVKHKYLKRNNPEPDIEMQPLNTNRNDKPLPKQQQIFKKLEMISNVADFERGEELGGGSFSVVYEGKLRGKPVAIKVARDEGRKSIHRELKIYDKTSHPHILSALGVHLGVDNMLFLPLRKFSLRDYFLDYGERIKFPQLQQYSIQVADGMAYLHNKNILHCDLKIENILIKDEKGDAIEISDFGSAIDLAFDYEIKFICTKTHIAYEILKTRPNAASTPVSKASDVWSFAVTMWQIFQKSDQLPIDFIKKDDIIKNYEAGKKLPIPATVSEDFWRYIILPCFDLHPKARPSMDDLHKCLLKYGEESSSASGK